MVGVAFPVADAGDDESALGGLFSADLVTVPWKMAGLGSPWAEMVPGRVRRRAP